jgi:predicted extracellular nuclease
MQLTPSILALASILLACRGPERPAERPRPENVVTFAFYNTENLFDADDDPTSAGDDEYMSGGRMHWSTERLEKKLTDLARAVRSIDGMNGPDIIGVCEVENRRVLDLLVTEYLPRGMYRVAHAESPDERGIDVALLYRPSIATLARVTMHTVDLGAWDDRTRDIMEATFTKDGRTFTVLVNHWPSRSGGEMESAPRREVAARTAARIIDSLYAVDPHADIVLMGDLNDEPSNGSVHDVLDARALASGFAHRMINTAAPVADADTIGSYFYHGDWETIDQIMVSRGALDSAGLVLYESSETVFTPEFLRDQKADPAHRPPYRTYKGGNYYIGGTSDHFPVLLRAGWEGREGKRKK